MSIGNGYCQGYGELRLWGAGGGEDTGGPGGNQGVLTRHGRVVWSGGKDSTALLELAADVSGALPVHAVWLDSGAEYRATVEMARRLRKRLDVVLHWY